MTLPIKLRTFFVGIFLFSFIIGFTPGAHAVFGLSKCERLGRAMKQEEQVGFELWRNLRNIRTDIIRKSPELGFSIGSGTKANSVNPQYQFSNVMVKDANNFYEKLAVLFTSDQNRYKLMESNSRCFSARDLADMRVAKARTTRAIGIINKQIRLWRGVEPNTVLTSNYYDYIVSIYPKYHAIKVKK